MFAPRLAVPARTGAGIRRCGWRRAADDDAVRMTARYAPAGDDDGAVRWPQGVGGVEALSVGMRCARCRRDEQGKGGKITIVEKDVVVPANPTNQTKTYLARLS